MKHNRAALLHLSICNFAYGAGPWNNNEKENDDWCVMLMQLEFCMMCSRFGTLLLLLPHIIEEDEFIFIQQPARSIHSDVLPRLLGLSCCLSLNAINLHNRYNWNLQLPCSTEIYIYFWALTSLSGCPDCIFSVILNLCWASKQKREKCDWSCFVKSLADNISDLQNYSQLLANV